MNITDVKIRRIYPTGKLKALVSVTIDEDLAVHDIKVIEGPERLFVAMPSRKEPNGTFRDTVHPITQVARHALERAILDEYMAQILQQEQSADEFPPSDPPDDAAGE